MKYMSIRKRAQGAAPKMNDQPSQELINLEELWAIEINAASASRGELLSHESPGTSQSSDSNTLSIEKNVCRLILRGGAPPNDNGSEASARPNWGRKTWRRIKSRANSEFIPLSYLGTFCCCCPSKPQAGSEHQSQHNDHNSDGGHSAHGSNSSHNPESSHTPSRHDDTPKPDPLTGQGEQGEPDAHKEGPRSTTGDQEDPETLPERSQSPKKLCVDSPARTGQTSSGAESSGAHEPDTSSSPAGPNTAEQSTTEQSTTEQSTTEQSTAESSTAGSKAVRPTSVETRASKSEAVKPPIGGSSVTAPDADEESDSRKSSGGSIDIPNLESKAISPKRSSESSAPQININNRYPSWDRDTARSLARLSKTSGTTHSSDSTSSATDKTSRITPSGEETVPGTSQTSSSGMTPAARRPPLSRSSSRQLSPINEGADAGNTVESSSGGVPPRPNPAADFTAPQPLGPLSPAKAFTTDDYESGQEMDNEESLYGSPGLSEFSDYSDTYFLNTSASGRGDPEPGPSGPNAPIADVPGPTLSAKAKGKQPVRTEFPPLDSMKADWGLPPSLDEEESDNATGSKDHGKAQHKDSPDSITRFFNWGSPFIESEDLPSHPARQEDHGFSEPGRLSYGPVAAKLGFEFTQPKVHLSDPEESDKVVKQEDENESEQSRMSIESGKTVIAARPLGSEPGTKESERGAQQEEQDIAKGEDVAS